MGLGLWPTAQDYAPLCVLGEYNSISKARSFFFFGFPEAGFSGWVAYAALSCLVSDNSTTIKSYELKQAEVCRCCVSSLTAAFYIPALSTEGFCIFNLQLGYTRVNNSPPSAVCCWKTACKSRRWEGSFTWKRLKECQCKELGEATGHRRKR